MSDPAPSAAAPAGRTVLLLLSGPAGSGKTTLCDRLVQTWAPALQRVVTATTRPPRPGERDGLDYHFLERPEFERRIAAGEFYEWAFVHRANYYGALKSEIRGKLERGLDLILNVDVQGATAYREAARCDPLLASRLVTIFIRPSSLADLEARLRGRGDSDPADIARRLETARREVAEWTRFHYGFTSADRESDFAALQAIYRAEKMRVPQA